MKRKYVFACLWFGRSSAARVRMVRSEGLVRVAPHDLWPRQMVSSDWVNGPVTLPERCRSEPRERSLQMMLSLLTALG